MEDMTINWHWLHPVFWATRAGIVPLLAAFSLAGLILASLIVVVWKPSWGYATVLTYARIQFLFVMVAIEVFVYYGLFAMCHPSSRMIMWVVNSGYLAAACVFHLGGIGLCATAVAYRYRQRPVVSAMDVVGMTVAGVCACLSFMIGCSAIGNGWR